MKAGPNWPVFSIPPPAELTKITDILNIMKNFLLYVKYI